MNVRITSPLRWPTGRKREYCYQRAKFERRTLPGLRERLAQELRRLGADWGEISIAPSRTPSSMPDDKGVSVYFRRRGQDYVLACDRWSTLDANLYAIILHIEALRGQERWGVGTIDQAVAGYLAGDPAWWTELGVGQLATVEEIDRAYKELAMARHPDRAGDTPEAREAWDRLQRAREQGLRARG